MTARITRDDGVVVVRTPLAPPVALSGRLSVRSVLVCSVLLVLTAVVTGCALMWGELDYSPAEVGQALFGAAPKVVELFVVDWRLPRALTAVLFGAMLGVAGAIFQSITRNPLGSPDIIGFTAGASAGGVAVVTFIGSSYHLIAGGALAGGLTVAAVVLLLSRGGGVAGFRLVITGIAINAMLTSLESWLVLTADLEQAQVATLWGTGSLNGVSFGYTGPALVVGTIVLILAGLLLGRPLRLLDLGDDASAALGVRPGYTRLLATLFGVLLIAIATSAAGPIAFVALAAPHVGRRLAGSSGTALAPSACAGAFVLATADLAAQHAIPEHSYPVGLVTVAVGGTYLITLIVRENRKGSL